MSTSLERLKVDLSLPGGELNPALPRDRRGYLPLYYRGSSSIQAFPMKLTKNVRKLIWNESWSHHDSVSFLLALSLCVTAQTNPMRRHAFDAADSLTRDLCVHFHVPCRTISRFAVRIKTETFRSSIQVAYFQAWRLDKSSDMAMESRCFEHWGISSIGRAPALHAGGTGIDARILQVLRNSFGQWSFSCKGSHFWYIFLLP